MKFCDNCEHFAVCKAEDRIIQTGYAGHEHYILALCRHCPLDYLVEKESFAYASAVEKTICELVEHGLTPEDLTTEDFAKLVKKRMEERENTR